MKIGEYGLFFQPMFFEAEPSLKLEPCAKYIFDNKTASHQDYHLGIKVIWNGKPGGWLQLKLVQDIIYVKLMPSRFREQDPIFFEKLLQLLPTMQDHGDLLVGTLIL